MNDIRLGVLNVEKIERRLDLGNIVAPTGSYILTNAFGKMTAVSKIVFDRLLSLSVEEPEGDLGDSAFEPAGNVNIPDMSTAPPPVDVEVPRDNIDA